MKQLEIIPLIKPITKTVEIPGSKSYTNRALFMAAMSKTAVIIKNPLKSDDTKSMIECLKALGAKIEEYEDRVEVQKPVNIKKALVYKLNAGLSGITIRFILALSTIIPGEKIITGEEGLNKRPIGNLVDALRLLGANIEYMDKQNFPPLKVGSESFKTHEVTIKGTTSSQFVSSLLMIAPLSKGLKINVEGEQISKPYIDMTIDTMGKFGVTVKNNNYKSYEIEKGQAYSLREYTVEGDYSGAGYFAAIAALTESKITMKNLNPNSKQGDKEFLTILEKMGNKIIFKENEVTVEGSRVKPITVNMLSCPDQAQTLAVLAAFADGVTRITGVRSLRVKETERVKALENELSNMGIKTESTHDSLTIYGGKPHAATIDTYGDHRMAMSFAIAGTKMKGMIINNPEVVSKTFPNFWKKLEEIGVKTI